MDDIVVGLSTDEAQELLLVVMEKTRIMESEGLAFETKNHRAIRLKWIARYQVMAGKLNGALERDIENEDNQAE